MASRAAKDWKALISELRAQNWVVEDTTRGHHKAFAPEKSKGIVTFSESEDQHAFLNTVKALQLRGFEWPAPSKKDLAGQLRRLVLAPQPARGLLEEEPEAEEPEEEAAPPAPPSAPVMRTAPITPPPPAEVSEEQAVDQAFASLREARLYHSLAMAEFLGKQRAHEETARQLELARAELSSAAHSLATSKDAFDKVIGAPPLAETVAPARKRGRPTNEERARRAAAGRDEDGDDEPSSTDVNALEIEAVVQRGGR